jgi:hypothetical protein
VCPFTEVSDKLFRTKSDQKQVDGAAFDYFIIEASSALRQSSAVALERHAKRERELVAAGLIAPIPPRHQALRKDGTTTPRDSIGSVKGPIELEDGEEALRMRLENIGNAVGGNLAERFVRSPSWQVECDVSIVPPGYVGTGHGLQIRWTSLNLSAKTSGRQSGKSQLTIYELIIGYVAYP